MLPSAASRAVAIVRAAAAFAALSGLAGIAVAQDAPPIKPGLWEVKTERTVDGRKMPDPAERLRNLPPEARARMQSMMKDRGVGMGAGDDGATRLCLSRESLDQGRWRGSQERCTTEIVSRSAGAWKWRSTCRQPDSESEGEAVFSSSEHYTVRHSMRMTVGGQERRSLMTMDARWLGADCGNIQPVQPRR